MPCARGTDQRTKGRNRGGITAVQTLLEWSNTRKILTIEAKERFKCPCLFHGGHVIDLRLKIILRLGERSARHPISPPTITSATRMATSSHGPVRLEMPPCALIERARRMPSGVSSKARAVIIVIGNASAMRDTTMPSNQSGNPIADSSAICVNSQSVTAKTPATRNTLRPRNSLRESNKCFASRWFLTGAQSLAERDWARCCLSVLATVTALPGSVRRVNVKSEKSLIGKH
jgi:hypothetical protein